MALTFIDNLATSVSGFSFLLNPWIAAASILVVTGILAWLLLQLFARVIEVFTKKTKTDIDDVAVEKIKSPLFWLLLVQGLRLSVVHVGINGNWMNVVNSFTAMAFVFLLSRLVDVFLFAWGKIMSKRTSSKLDDVLLPLLHKFSVVVFWIIGIMWVLSIWNVDITPYLAGAGIAGIVLGMALQDSLKNVLGGVSLLIDGAIKVGDKIRIDSGDVGEVVDITLRSTKLRTYDNEMITVPNGYLANSKVQNYTKPSSKSRVYVDFGVAYGTKVERVSEVVLSAINSVEGIMPDPAPAVQFIGMGDSSLNHKLYFWVARWQDAYSKKLEATRVVYNALNEANINIPFPTRTLHLIDDSKNANVDAKKKKK